LLGQNASYTGIDVPVADDFGMTKHSDVVPFDGQTIPFEDASFDHILCTEVLEHVEDPASLIAEMSRVLRPGGTIVVTVPFSARVHHAPHDYHRYTSFRLRSLFAPVGNPGIEERGDDLAVIANKLIVICMRLARPSTRLLWCLPLLVLMLPITLLALAMAHFSLWFGWGSKADPLGYGVTTTKI
jgi:SAM-dependent methyltransferase